MLQIESTAKEAKKRKVTAGDIQVLNGRAELWGQIGGPTKQRIERQAREAYALQLDFLRLGLLGLDFIRWLSKNSGLCYSTCWRRLQAGRALATGSKRNRNQAGLTEELKERKEATSADLNWEETIRP